MNLFDFQCKDIKGNPFDMNQLRGKKVLLINTASECGFTKQFSVMEELYQNTSREKFEMIGIPSNDFGAQDPGSNIEILDFCQVNYGVSFPMMEKMTIKGEQKNELFAWLCKELNCAVDWNFQKFLIDEEGIPFKTLSSATLPIDEQILNWIHE
jgi:glutathione peroxidase